MRRGRYAACSRSLAAALALAVSVSLALSGCGLLGKPIPLSAVAPIKLSVTSPVFSQNVIPARFTCHGAGKSPPIFWTGTPPGTKSLALVIDDSDAPIAPKVYWIVFDIGPGTTYIQGDALPPNARVAQNSAGKAGYDPPCPGSAPHYYRFTVYALNTFFGKSLPASPALLQAWTAIARHVIARGTMTAKACPTSLPSTGSQCASTESSS